jgi:simple sugar transport system permease protein
MQAARTLSLRKLFLSLLLVVCILSVWALIIWFGGESPFKGFSFIIEGSLGNHYLILAAAAVAVPAWTGMWNIGGEGQLLLGAFGAALVGFSIDFGAGIVNIVVALLVSAAFGMAWAAWPAIFKIKLRMDEVVTTLMGNYIAAQLIAYLINKPFRDPRSPLAQTPYIKSSYVIPYLFEGSQFSATFLIAIGIVLVLFVFRKKFIMGYEFEITGSNSDFAELSGVKVKKIKLLSMLIGGALAGLAGGLLVLGMTQRVMQSFSPGYGFTGLLICLLAFNDPLIIIGIAFLFSVLQTGSVNLQLFSSVPAEISGVLQAVMVLFVAAFKTFIVGRRDS